MSIEANFEEAIEFIGQAKEKKGACLVHCSHGMSRSVTFVLAYLIEKKEMSLSEALAFTRNLRPVASL